MKALFDLHTHTLSSGHSFSTLMENVREAKNKGLVMMGTSDHAPMMPGSAQSIFFTNYKVIPEKMEDVYVLGGIEANIMDYSGVIDVDKELYGKLAYIIASLHTPCIKPSDITDNTNALIGAMKNPYVKIIGHPDDSRYPLDYDRLTDAAAEYEVALELNNSSFDPRSTRKGADKNAYTLLEYCKKKNVNVIMGSDAHICYDIGNFTQAQKVLSDVDFPENQVLNYRLEGLKCVLNVIPAWL